MAGSVVEIWRYPVKGPAGKPLRRVAVSAGRALQNDRRFAIAHGDTGITAEAPRWASKTSFHMPMHGKDERLVGLAPSYDEQMRGGDRELGDRSARPPSAEDPGKGLRAHVLRGLS